MLEEHTHRREGVFAQETSAPYPQKNPEKGALNLDGDPVRGIAGGTTSQADFLIKSGLGGDLFRTASTGRREKEGKFTFVKKKIEGKGSLIAGRDIYAG